MKVLFIGPHTDLTLVCSVLIITLPGLCADTSLQIQPAVTGLATCRPPLPPCSANTDVPSGLEVATCGCWLGEVPHNGLCAKPFRGSLCENGQILVPTDLSVGHKLCPSSFKCTKKDFCPNYRISVKNVLWTKSKELKSYKQKVLDDLICDESGESICCPQGNDGDILTSHNLLQSYKNSR